MNNGVQERARNHVGYKYCEKREINNIRGRFYTAIGAMALRRKQNTSNWDNYKLTGVDNGMEEAANH